MDLPLHLRHQHLMLWLMMMLRMKLHDCMHPPCYLWCVDTWLGNSLCRSPLEHDYHLQTAGVFFVHRISCQEIKSSDQHEKVDRSHHRTHLRNSKKRRWQFFLSNHWTFRNLLQSMQNWTVHCLCRNPLMSSFYQMVVDGGLICNQCLRENQPCCYVLLTLFCHDSFNTFCSRNDISTYHDSCHEAMMKLQVYGWSFVDFKWRCGDKIQTHIACGFPVSQSRI